MTAPDEWYDASDWVDHDPDYGRDLDEDDEYPDAEEWEPYTGTCDRCLMAPGEVNDFGPFALCCACSIGQGAPPDECVCGPRRTPENGDAQ